MTIDELIAHLQEKRETFGLYGGSRVFINMVPQDGEVHSIQSVSAGGTRHLADNWVTIDVTGKLTGS